MKLQKFSNFAKNRKLNENQTDLMPEPEEMSDELMMSGTTKPTIAPPIVPTKPKEPQTAPPVIKQPVETPQRKANVQMTEEEESDNQIDTDLNELATELGAEKVGNVINYNGMEIEFYSEPMSFAINGQVKFNVGGKKMELKTIQDVIEYVTTMEPGSPAQAQRSGNQRAQAQGGQTQTQTQAPGRAPQTGSPGQQRPVTKMGGQAPTVESKKYRRY
jgi:hypothetical protein